MNILFFIKSVTNDIFFIYILPTIIILKNQGNTIYFPPQDNQLFQDILKENGFVILNSKEKSFQFDSIYFMSRNEILLHNKTYKSKKKQILNNYINSLKTFPFSVTTYEDIHKNNFSLSSIDFDSVQIARTQCQAENIGFYNWGTPLIGTVRTDTEDRCEHFIQAFSPVLDAYGAILDLASYMPSEGIAPLLETHHVTQRLTHVTNVSDIITHLLSLDIVVFSSKTPDYIIWLAKALARPIVWMDAEPAKTALTLRSLCRNHIACFSQGMAMQQSVLPKITKSSTPPKSPLRILLVSTGQPTPPTGWGAVEKLIWEQKQYLEREGHNVTLHNITYESMQSALLSLPTEYDVVHVHYDVRTLIWNLLEEALPISVLITTHYGYTSWVERWGEFYWDVFSYLKQASHIMALSPQIKSTLQSQGCKGDIFVLPNGIICDDIRFAPVPSKSALVLGRIEYRKKQEYLADILRGYPISLDLIGPPSDENNMTLGFVGNGENVRWCGEWTRDQVNDMLTEYSCLILLSDGEAHPLVILEALAAGVSVVISEEASHNLDTRLPFITVVNRDSTEEIVQAIQKSIMENPKYRQQITQYCRSNFDWSILIKQYIDVYYTIRDKSK
jgi:glycosyltransferase involved in cell wall biosynthesis